MHFVILLYVHVLYLHTQSGFKYYVCIDNLLPLNNYDQLHLECIFLYRGHS